MLVWGSHPGFSVRPGSWAAATVSRSSFAMGSHFLLPHPSSMRALSSCRSQWHQRSRAVLFGLPLTFSWKTQTKESVSVSPAWASQTSSLGAWKAQGRRKPWLFSPQVPAVSQPYPCSRCSGAGHGRAWGSVGAAQSQSCAGSQNRPAKPFTNCCKLTLVLPFQLFSHSARAPLSILF